MGRVVFSREKKNKVDIVETCGFYRGIYGITVSQLTSSLLWVLTTLWLIIKISLQNTNGIFIFKISLMSFDIGRYIIGGLTKDLTLSMYQALRKLLVAMADNGMLIKVRV